MKNRLIFLLVLLFVNLPTFAAVVGTAGTSTGARIVDPRRAFVTRIDFPATTGQKVDSFVVRVHDNFTAPDSAIGLLYTGTTGDIATVLTLSSDTAVINTTTGNETRMVFHVSGTVNLTASATLYIGLQRINLTGTNMKVLTTDNSTNRTGHDSTSVPPPSPWSLTEYTSLPNGVCSLYYSAASVTLQSSWYGATVNGVTVNQ